jgi:hypothetical protein
MSVLETKLRSFSLSPKRNKPSSSDSAGLLGFSISPRGRSPKKSGDGVSDVAVVKKFVRKLNHRRVDLSELVTLQTVIVIDGRPMDLADFLKVCHYFSKLFKKSLPVNTHPAAVNNQIVAQYSRDLPDTKISVQGTKVKDDPFPYDSDAEPERPEMLQCVVEDGMLRRIHWKAVDKPNRKGFLRYVKTKKCRT